MEEFQAVTPLDVVQLPYSLFSREVEVDLLPFAEKCGIGVMGYAALAQGYLTGTFTDPPSFEDGDFRRGAYDFSGDRYARRVRAADQMAEIASTKGCSLPDLAVAWVASQEVPVVPMVGVQARSHVDALVRALDISLTTDDQARLRTLAETAPEMDFAGLVS
jgi:aryl-alcohol dehydrogenase-like predicted oxidoreductase